MQFSCSCLPLLTDPQQQQHKQHNVTHSCNEQEGSLAWDDLGRKDQNSSRCASTGSCPVAHRQQTQRSAQHTFKHHMNRRYQQQQRHSGWVLVAAVLVWALLAGQCWGLPNVDISIGPPTAKTAAISYTWGIAASVTPPQVTMSFTEARPVSLPVGCPRGFLGRGGRPVHACMHACLFQQHPEDCKDYCHVPE